MSEPLLDVTVARRQLLADVSPTAKETVSLDESLGRVLADDLVSSIMVPPFDNSAMDGFALRAEDTESEGNTVTLDVVSQIQAGSAQQRALRHGQAARIMTGAPMPPGADTVVPFEETTSDGDRVTLPARRVGGVCVRPAGLDIVPGQKLLDHGTRIGPAQIALAASAGTAELSVLKKPVVAVLATGDELVEPGTPLEPGQIYNSNAHGLSAAIRQLGADPVVLQPARDDAAALRETLASISGVDLILTSGGVSVGDFDYVKQVMGELGQIEFWRVRMRPGKPLMLGRLANEDGSSTRILGLPGNPTSTMVTFYVFARPLILKLMGVADPLPEPIMAVSDEDLDNRGGRETYFRVRLEHRNGAYIVRLSGGQDSSMLLPLAQANALARVPADVELVRKGQTIEAFPL